MADPNIRTQLTDTVLTIEFWRREKKNAITTAMYTALADAFEDAAQRSDVAVVLLRGQPDLFTAGNDVTDFLTAESRKTRAALRFLRAIATLPQPLLAAVGGPAIGIGCTMLLHCDLVVAAQGATFHLPFVQLGLSPEGASSLLLPQMAGPRVAAELLLLGEPFSAERAREIGMVNAVVAEDALIAHAEGWAARIAARPRDAVRTTKALLKGSQSRSPVQAIEEEIPHFERLLMSPEARAVFQSFLSRGG